MYTKEQIVNSKTYRQYRDVLAVVLSEDKTYTHDEIKQKLDEFLHKSIKEKRN